MPKTSIPFLQLIQDEAAQNQFLTVNLPDQQGIVVFPQDSSTQQQIDLLRTLILDLAVIPARITSPESTRDKTDLDCQVTVEERAQLFNFLHSSN